MSRHSVWEHGRINEIASKRDLRPVSSTYVRLTVVEWSRRDTGCKEAGFFDDRISQQETYR